MNETGTEEGSRSVVINYRECDLVVALQANALPCDSEKHAQAIAQIYLPPVHDSYPTGLSTTISGSP